MVETTLHDVGGTSTNIQAAAPGYFIHQMAGFDVSKAKETWHS